MTPVYLFPVMDADNDVQGAERRVYDDVVMIGLDDAGNVLAEPCSSKGPRPDRHDEPKRHPRS